MSCLKFGASDRPYFEHHEAGLPKVQLSNDGFSILKIESIGRSWNKGARDPENDPRLPQSNYDIVLRHRDVPELKEFSFFNVRAGNAELISQEQPGATDMTLKYAWDHKFTRQLARDAFEKFMSTW